MCVDPKSVKIYWQFDWVLTLWGATGVTAARKYVDEIDPWWKSSIDLNVHYNQYSSERPFSLQLVWSNHGKVNYHAYLGHTGQVSLSC